jgi:hypothetical protein
MVKEGIGGEWLDEEDVVEEVALLELAEEDSHSSDSSLLDPDDETELDSLASAYSGPLSSLALSLSACSGSPFAIRLLVSWSATYTYLKHFEVLSPSFTSNHSKSTIPIVLNQ